VYESKMPLAKLWRA